MASSMATAASIPAASVSLHPLASRNGQHSSTIVSVQVPQTTSHHDGLPPLEDIQATLDAPMLCDDQSAHSPLTPRTHPSNGNGHQNGHSIDGHRPSGAAAYASLPGAFVDADSQQYQPKMWGIQHEDINQYPIIDDQPAMCTCIEEDNYPSILAIDDAPPIRAMTAAQLDELHKQYLSLDVPHSVVFPFLHGVDGSNVAQNHFFKAPLSGQPSPNYRGLTIVRADLPTPPQQNRSAARRKRTSSVGSKLSMGCTSSNGQQSHGRTDSATSSSISSHATGATSIDSRRSSERNDDEENYGKVGPLRTETALPLSATGSSASISSSMASSEASGNSLFSHDDHRFDSHTSIETGQTDHDEDMASMPGKIDKSQRGLSASPAESFDPQPDTCLLISTLFPYELIVPPLMMDPQSNNCYYARPSTRPRRNESAMLQTANFIDPKQAPGVNLRNFKIQAVKYATISDIVIYCPTGYHEGMLSYARWFRDAHEGSYDERCERGLGGLRYNVFIVTEPFDVFEHYHPHLVAVDRMGGLRNRVDFIDREREEMQRLTAAAPIDDNVWLGCTGDSPSLNDDAASVAPSHEFNPKGFSVSIEFHEQGEVPDSNKLLQASQCLDHHRWGDGTMDGLLKETFNSTTDDGWYRDGFESPSSPTLATASLTNGSGKASSYRRTDLPATASGLSSPASSFIRREGNVVHLECHSFSTDPKAKASELEAVSETQKKVDSILRLCAWIQTQAQPWKTPLQATANAPGYGILAGALRSVHYARQNNSGSFGRTASVRHAHREAHNGAATAPWNKRRERRVLLHCADGYTETSILALAYLMYSRGLSLPEAYLDLQDRAKRSFFVYNRDLPLLKELEKQISILRRDAAGEGVPEHASRPRNKHGFPWLGNDEHHGKRRNASCTSPRRNSASSLGPEAIEHNSWMRGLVGWVGASSKRSSPVNASSDALLSPPSRTVTPTPASMASQSSLNTATIQDSSAVTSPSAVSETSSNAWFYSPRFEGSFPSRILPFLYLGNLNHALNASMLHALGITHVVSVGESALQPPAASGSAVADSNGGQTALPSPAEQESANSLWQEEKAGRISVLDRRNVSDDGIDPLRSTMRVAVEYIEAARRAGGKVLVHCRVGVSRSTTIVLAYVMAHLDLTLVESYLLVRSRRLSILIQPHLLFFWELRGWEAYVASQKLKRRLILETGRSSQEQAQDASAVLAEAHFSLAGLSLQGSAVRGEVMNRISSVGSSCGFGSSSDGSDSVVADDLDVDIGAGVGASYHLNTNDDVSRAAFGSGSPSGIPAEALRLNWGFLCREITVLNERYF